VASFNRVILVGNLTRDPELRYTPGSMAVTELGLAVNDRRKNAQGEWIEETTFVDVTLWGRTAEVACEYLKKGSSTLIEGRLKLDSWESQDGKKMSKLRVVGEKMQMLGGRGGPGGGGASGGGGGGASRGGRSGPGAGPSYDENEFGGDSGEPAPAPRGSGKRPPPSDDDIPF
jgi:single-strand DNA-binding protein